MKSKTKEFAKKTAEEIAKIGTSHDQKLIYEILSGSMISLENNKNRILAIKVGNKIFEIWKSDKNDGKFDVVGQDKVVRMTREEIIKNIILRAFYQGKEYRKISKKI